MVYHFTRSSTFLNFIGPYARLRLSPFSHSFDPRERLPVSLGLGVSSNDPESPGFDELIAAQEQLTDLIRNKAQMLCFSNSYSPLCPSMQWDHDGDRGWAQSAMWAHFADRHSGVCLEIDKDRFLLDLFAVTKCTATVLSGDVIYMGSGDTPLHLPSLNVSSMADATPEVMLGHVLHNSIAPFFRKDQCWAYEQEFRVVALNSCGELVYIPIDNSLRGVILGDHFPDDLIPVVSWIMEKRGLSAQVKRMRWLPGPYSVGPFPLESGDCSHSRVKSVDLSGGSPAPASTETQHSHDESCDVKRGHAPSAADRLSSWRESLLSAYRRRLARSLESVCAESQLGFSIRNVPGHLTVGADPIPMGVDLIEIDSLADERLLTVRFATSYAFGDSSSRVVQVECQAPDHPLRARQWDIQDGDPDSVILSILYELDSLVNAELAILLQSRVPGATQTAEQRALDQDGGESSSAPASGQ